MTTSPLPELDQLPSLSTHLAAHDLFAKKSFGQHFLLDMNLTDKIARLCAPHPVIVEIGPGPGGLTRSLLRANAEKLYIIEKDPRFVPLLEEIQTKADDRLTILNDDALRVDPAKLHAHRPLRICANLPYNVGTKMVINWLTASPIFWDRMVLMLQKEVAQRIAAAPNTKAYGRLAVLAQSIAVCHIAFEVPAKAFTPPPKVDSAIIVMDVLPEAKRYPHLKTLAQITAASFGQRRKMLRKSLKPLAKANGLELETWLETANIEPTVRPETLSVMDFHRLSDALIAAQ